MVVDGDDVKNSSSQADGEDEKDEDEEETEPEDEDEKRYWELKLKDGVKRVSHVHMDLFTDQHAICASATRRAFHKVDSADRPGAYCKIYL
jgi:hypothetical protein